MWENEEDSFSEGCISMLEAPVEKVVRCEADAEWLGLGSRAGNSMGARNGDMLLRRSSTVRTSGLVKLRSTIDFDGRV
jgi:hypothetical protein